MRWLILLLLAGGCAARSDRVAPHHDEIIFLVPGVGGPTSQYQGLIDGLHDGGIEQPVQIVRWGAPGMFFFMNFNDAGIHESAERALAERIANRRADHPTARIDIIAHSAGCGVTLGALKRLQREQVDTVVLLAPSVSPRYELDSAMQRIAGELHIFVSDRDKTFLGWRTSTFGTYDSIKTPAAGNRGFARLPPRALQHRYEATWRSLGNDGDHFGSLARKFARDVIAPLLSATDGAPSRSQSSAANPR